MAVKISKSPVIAIVGRPNVGKSSLFNALLQRKQSLVAPIPGVTRDIVESSLEWENLEGKLYLMELWDTGGMTQSVSHDFLEKTIEMAQKAILEADLLLFVVDGRQGITQDDLTIADQLRKEKFSKTFLVVNKVDHEQHQDGAYEFYNLGFPQTFFVSCAHRLGLTDLKEAIEEYFQETEQAPKIGADIEGFSENAAPNDIYCTLLGKPNAGKSSFFNRVIGMDRSIVSDIPGTTRDVLLEKVEYHDKCFQFFDTAGFRRRTKVVDSLEQDSLKKALWALRKSEVAILLIDASLGTVTEQDKKLLDLIIKEKRGIVIGLNKWDLVSQPDRKIWQERMDFYLKDAKYFPIVPLSTQKGKGIWQVLDAVARVSTNYRQKLKAREITLFLKERVKEKPPFSKLGILKIFYGSQVRQTPPEFEIFVNNEKILTPSYERYLTHALYDHFSLEGVPFGLVFKNRR